MALYTAPPRRPSAPKSDRETYESAAELIQLHQHRLPTAKKIQAIMNGGEGGLKELLGALPKNAWSVPAANLFLSASDRLAQKLGDRPDARVDPPAHTDAQTPRERAAKLERIVEFFDEAAELELDLPQVGRWLPGYGFVCWIIQDGWTEDGHSCPIASLRDPIDVFPGPWGPSQQPDRLVVRRRIERRKLAAIYGERSPLSPGRPRGVGGAVLLEAGEGAFAGAGGTDGGGWEGSAHADAVDLFEFFDAWGCTVLLGTGHVLERIPNRLDSGPQFVVVKRYAFDALAGVWDQGIGLLAQMARFNMAVKILMEDSINAPTVINGRMDQAFRFGRFAYNFVEGGEAKRMKLDVPYQLFTEIDRIERQFRVQVGYSPQQDGESPMSFVTGRGLSELATGIDNAVREYHKALKAGLQRLDSKRLEWATKMPDAGVSRPMYGARHGQAFSENYTPSKDIGPMRRTRRAYGAMAGFDDHQKIVAGLQLVGARVISRRTMQENMSGLDNLPRENDRINAEQAEETLIQMMLGASSGQPLDPRAALTLIEFLPDGDMKKAMQHFWTPEGEEIDPEQQALIDQQAAAQQQPTELPGQTPDVSTVLSILGAEGGVGGGAQTLSRL